jgi:site-specific recombinase XerC
MLSKGGELLRSLRQVVVVQLAAAMELVAGRIFCKAGLRMERLVQAEVRTILKAVLAIRVMGAGNSERQYHVAR